MKLQYRGNIISPYWLQYFGGTVHAFEMAHDHKHRRLILDDLEEGGFNVKDVKSDQPTIIVITWLKMRTSGIYDQEIEEFRVT